eukprot:IDg8390t1
MFAPVWQLGNEIDTSLQQLHDVLQVHRTDEAGIGDDDPQRSLANAPDTKKLFCVHSHLFYLMKQEYRR